MPTDRVIVRFEHPTVRIHRLGVNAAFGHGSKKTVWPPAVLDRAGMMRDLKPITRVHGEIQYAKPGVDARTIAWAGVIEGT